VPGPKSFALGDAMTYHAGMRALAAMAIALTLHPAPAGAEATCGEFLAAYAQGQGAPYVDSQYAILEQLDIADAARGCHSVMASEAETELQKSLVRMCGPDPRVMLYVITRAIYGEERAISGIGLGDGCR
jgi:hypothetical protein